MRITEAKRRWKIYARRFAEGSIDENEFARELLGRDMSIESLCLKLKQYTKLADVHEENTTLLLDEIKQLEQDMAPFQNQIDQRKTYKCTTDHSGKVE